MVVAHVTRSRKKLTQDMEISTATKGTKALECIRRSLLTMTLADIKASTIQYVVIIKNNAAKTT